jgi:hypothetical protein
MGFSWALYFAQKVNEHCMKTVPTMTDSLLMNDSLGSAVVNLHDKDSKHYYIYVDNIGVLCLTYDLLVFIINEIVEVFNKQGLEMHEIEVLSDSAEALGTELDLRRHRSRVSNKRFWKIRLGTKAVLKRGRCSGQALEVVIGHMTFASLQNRYLLSIFHSVYKFIDAHYYECKVLWPSVAAELQAWIGLEIFLSSSWVAPWCPVIFASDASLGGWGVASSIADVQQVAAVGRVSERRRFKKLLRENPLWELQDF